MSLEINPPRGEICQQCPGYLRYIASLETQNNYNKLRPISTEIIEGDAGCVVNSTNKATVGGLVLFVQTRGQVSYEFVGPTYQEDFTAPDFCPQIKKTE